MKNILSQIKLKKRYILIFLVGIFAFIVRIYQLPKLPGEWYGDISNVHEYVTQILNGEWPFYFFQSPGPLYHYLIIPIVWIWRNHGYETYKIASLIISLIGLYTTYLFIAEISSFILALLATLVMSFSFWYLIWSRLGNSQIIIPALTSLVSYYLAKYIKKGKFINLVTAATVASLGWYTYPQTFIFPVIFFFFLIIYFIFIRKLKTSLLPLLLILIILAVAMIPFLGIISKQKDNFGVSGYIGQKILPITLLSKKEIANKMISNFVKTMAMLHIQGDGSFRINIANYPQLDRISGLLFFAGFFYFLSKKRRIWFFYFIFMLILLPLPSISPVLPDGEIPNNGRTIALIPYVYTLVAAGILWLYQLLRKIMEKRYSITGFISILFVYVSFINIRLYFFDYQNGLPDRNLAPGKIIAKYIDTFPSKVALYFANCCWGEWGEPEPKGIYYLFSKSRSYIKDGILVKKCEEIVHRPALILISSKDEQIAQELRKCSTEAEIDEVKDENGLLVAKLILLK